MICKEAVKLPGPAHEWDAPETDNVCVFIEQRCEQSEIYELLTCCRNDDGHTERERERGAGMSHIISYTLTFFLHSGTHTRAHTHACSHTHIS